MTVETRGIMFDKAHPCRIALERILRAYEAGKGVRLTHEELCHLSVTLEEVWGLNREILDNLASVCVCPAPSNEPGPHHGGACPLYDDDFEWETG